MAYGSNAQALPLAFFPAFQPLARQILAETSILTGVHSMTTESSENKQRVNTQNNAAAVVLRVPVISDTSLDLRVGAFLHV